MALRIETPRALDDDLTERFLKLYRIAFEPMEILAAARQSLNDEEFVEEMAHPSVFKWVGYDDFGEAVAMAFMATDLKQMPWISEPYYAHHFPEHYARGAIYYFGALLVHPDYRGGANVMHMLEAVITKIAADDAIAAFDCCAFNIEKVRLPEMIARVAHRLCTVDVREIDVQRYYAYEMKDLKA